MLEDYTNCAILQGLGYLPTELLVVLLF